jgi:DNA-binding LacI/PurR family transcriptional regulator
MSASHSSGRASIYTISKELGISAATVSRALRNHPAISSAVRKSVQEVARKTQYRPRFMRTQVINLCVLIQQLDEHPLDFGPFVSQMLEGVAEYCREEQLEMSLFSTHVHELNQCDVVRELRRRNADGAIVLRADRQSRFLSQMTEHAFPFFCLLNNDGQSSEHLLAIDEEQLAYDAIRYLLEQGHRRIGAIVAAPSNPASQMRLKGYQRAMHEYGVEPAPQWLFLGDPVVHRGGVNVGLAGIEALRANDPTLTAVFTTCEESARGVLYWLNRHAVRIPDEMSVIGFDDFADTAFTWPALTTMRIPYTSIAYEGARQVHRLIRHLPIQMNDDVKEKISGKLIVRETVGLVPKTAVGAE